MMGITVKKIIVSCILILGVILIQNCSSAKEFDMKSGVKKLMETDREFSKTSLKIGAAEAFNMYAAEGAIMLTAGRQPIYGKKAVKKIMMGIESILRWEPVDGQVAASGDLGYTWGRYVATAKDEQGNETEFHGKYVSIWKKQKDGSWKWIVDIGNDNPSPGSD